MGEQRQHSLRYLPDLTQQYFDSTSVVFLSRNVAYANYSGRCVVVVLVCRFCTLDTWFAATCKHESKRKSSKSSERRFNNLSFQKTYKPKECQMTRHCHRINLGRSRVSIFHGSSVTCVNIDWTLDCRTGIWITLWT